MTAQQDNEVRDLARKIYGDNALEFVVGLLSSLTSDEQGDALISSLRADPKSWR